MSLSPAQLREVFVEKLSNISRDPEGGHVEAETILCEALTALGYQEISEAFEEARKRVGFWYA